MKSKAVVKRKRVRSWAAVALAVAGMVLVPLSPMFTPAPANAAADFSKNSISDDTIDETYADEKVKAFSYAVMMRQCFKEAFEEKAPGKLRAHIFYHNDNFRITVSTPVHDGNQSNPCSTGNGSSDYNPSWIDDAFSLWGISRADLLCKMYSTTYKEDRSGAGIRKNDPVDCQAYFRGDLNSLFDYMNNWAIPDNVENVFYSKLNELTGLSMRNDMDTTSFGSDNLAAARWYWKILTKANRCDLSDSATGGYTVKQYDERGAITTKTMAGEPLDKEVETLRWQEDVPLATDAWMHWTLTCQEVLDIYNQRIELTAASIKAAGEAQCTDKYNHGMGTALINYEYQNPTTGSRQTLSDTQLNACKKGFNNKNNQSYCSTYYSGSGLLENACKSGAGIESDIIESSELDEEVTSEPPTCESNGGSFGWVMCPLIEMLSGMVDGIMGAITNQLNYQALNDNPTTIKEAWDKFVPIANIGFAIVFLIIIYSTAIGGGIGGGKSGVS